MLNDTAKPPCFVKINTAICLAVGVCLRGRWGGGFKANAHKWQTCCLLALLDHVVDISISPLPVSETWMCRWQIRFASLTDHVLVKQWREKNDDVSPSVLNSFTAV